MTQTILILASCIFIYSFLMLLHYAFESFKIEKGESQREMESIDTLIDDALSGERLPNNRYKTQNKTN
jgi:hypothetical protein